MRERDHAMAQIAEALGVSVATLYRHMPPRPADGDDQQAAVWTIPGLTETG
ncbi:MAG: hypothetical protein ABSG43_31025 [Solirubrobacteraceae bacterium]